MRADVVVVGGGPSGCFIGGALAKQGFDVVIVEEHHEVGIPTCCTGILGMSGLRELGIRSKKRTLAKLRRAVFYPPSNEPVELTRNRVEAAVIDRVAFDRELERDALNAGATLLLKTRCVDLKLGQEPAAVKLNGTGKEEIKTRLIVGADGATSVVARKTGLLRVARYLRCAQVETPAEVQADTAELYLSNSLARGFFAWLVPTGGSCRAGLGTIEGEAPPKLRSFLETHPVASRKVKSEKIPVPSTGLIPEPLSRKIYADRVMLVGDAAGHVKPLTGGGIYLGLSCARVAAEIAAVALEKEPTVKTLRAYEDAVKKKFGRELRLGVRFRRVFERMTDGDLNSVFGLLKREDIRDLVIKNFDFDHHYKMLRAFLTEAPKLPYLLGLKRALRYSRFLLGIP